MESPKNVLIPKTESSVEKKVSETESSIEKEIFEILIEKAIIDSQKINEGNNGVIKKISTDQLSANLVEYLNSKNPNFFRDNGTFVAKILKIYNQGVGVKEYEMHKKAFDLVQEGRSQGLDLALVPEPLLFTDLKISDPEAKESLKRDGLTNFNDHVEVVFMDYIKGSDLATTMFRLIVKHAQQDEFLSKKLLVPECNPDELSIFDLQTEIAHLLDFSRPGGNHRDENMRIHEEQKVNSENAEKIKNFFKRKKITLNPLWAKKIGNTIKYLNQNNFHHRDLHERNIMMGDDGEIYLIDFGSSVIASPSETVRDIYENGDSKRPQDNALLTMWGDIFKTSDEMEKESHDQNFQELSSLKSALEKRGMWKLDGIEDLTAENFNSKIELLANGIVKNGTLDQKENVRLLLLLELHKKNPELARLCAVNATRQGSSITWQNKLRKIIKVIQ